MAAFYEIFYGALNLLLLLAAGGGAVVALVMRGRFPKRATYATLGFGMFALYALVYLLVSPFFANLLGVGGRFYLVTDGFAALLFIGAIGMLSLALFRSDDTPRQPGQPQYGQPPAQYQQPQPQYQGQPPAQPMQQPQQYGPPQAPHPQYQQAPQQPPQPPHQHPGSGY